MKPQIRISLAVEDHDRPQPGDVEIGQSIINPDDACFANPSSMVEAIKQYCEKTGQHVPQNYGEFCRCIFESLALRYRQIFTWLKDFADFDLLLAMDRDHFHYLRDRAPEGCRHKVRMFLSFAARATRDDVPDPYYGGGKGFDVVLDLCEDAVQGMIEEIRPEVERRKRSAV